jgi:hypothetical protein
MQETLGQIYGIVATVIITSAYQANTKKGLLMIQTPGVVLLWLSYLVLRALDGFVLNAVCVARNVCCFFIKENTRPYYAMTGVLLVGIGTLGFVFWQSYLSLLLIVALVANTFFIALGKPQVLRYSLLVTSSMCLLYNCLLSPPCIGGIALESITIISATIGIVRCVRKREASSPTESE